MNVKLEYRQCPEWIRRYVMAAMCLADMAEDPAGVIFDYLLTIVPMKSHNLVVCLLNNTIMIESPEGKRLVTITIEK